MTVREIVTPPNPTLRKKAARVRAVTAQTRALVDDMIETMRVAPGVGLAAPQVDVSQRVIVVEYAEYAEDAEETEAEETPPKLYVVINPEIVRASPETVLGTEGCLSLPGIMGEVERQEWVTVKGLDRNGNPFKKKARGWLARIFQHEIDHLDGILFIDHALQVWRVDTAVPHGDKLPTTHALAPPSDAGPTA
ncbi:MAG: peptide deformylase [Anaerolineales bacterium]|nr:MAG: peptide deformylase [Anaerolineales bacterium]